MNADVSAPRGNGAHGKSKAGNESVKRLASGHRLPSRWCTDLKFLGLHIEARTILAMLWLAPDMPMCGIGPLSVWQLAERLRLPVPRVRKRLAELEAADFLRQDSEASQCWLLTYVETQLGGMPASNRPWTVNTVAAVRQLAQTALTLQYLEHYGLSAWDPLWDPGRDPRRDPARDPAKKRDPMGGPPRLAPIRSISGVGVAGALPTNAPPTKPGTRSGRKGNGRG